MLAWQWGSNVTARLSACDKLWFILCTHAGGHHSRPEYMGSLAISLEHFSKANKEKHWLVAGIKPWPSTWKPSVLRTLPRMWDYISLRVYKCCFVTLWLFNSEKCKTARFQLSLLLIFHAGNIREYHLQQPAIGASQPSHFMALSGKQRIFQKLHL